MSPVVGPNGPGSDSPTPRVVSMTSPTGFGRRGRRHRARARTAPAGVGGACGAGRGGRGQRAHVARGRCRRSGCPGLPAPPAPEAAGPARSGARCGGGRGRRGGVRADDVRIGQRLGAGGARGRLGAEVRQRRAGGRLAERAEPAEPSAGCHGRRGHEQHERREERNARRARGLLRPLPDHRHEPMVDTPRRSGEQRAGPREVLRRLPLAPTLTLALVGLTLVLALDRRAGHRQHLRGPPGLRGRPGAHATSSSRPRRGCSRRA